MQHQKSVTSDRPQVLVARTTAGFFGLNELHSFFVDKVDPYLSKASDKAVVLDFSSVLIWDISATLWMTIALDYYVKLCSRPEKNCRIHLKLPEPTAGMVGQQRVNYQKSADFLRRWNFESALKNISPDPATLLIPEQAGYFQEPSKFYVASEVADDGVLHQLISRELAEIRNLCDRSGVSVELVDEVKRKFTARRFGDVLHSLCGFDKGIGTKFSNQILNEGIRNVSEHPNATIGMVALGSLGRADRLIMAIVDNGEPIPVTIYPHYLYTQNQTQNPRGPLPEVLNGLDQLPAELVCTLIQHATEPGVSRKSLFVEGQNGQYVLNPIHDDATVHSIGYGLTYIRNDSIDSVDGFGGSMMITSGGASVRYTEHTGDERGASASSVNYGFRWPGNLIRISIPIAKRK